MTSGRYHASMLEHLLYDKDTGPALGRDIPGAFFMTFRLGLGDCWAGKADGLTFENDTDGFVDEVFEQVDLMDWFVVNS